MALPDDILKGTVTFGQAVSFISGTPTSLTFTITPTHDLVHEETGIQLLAFSEEISAADGMPGSISLPFTDQDGFVDENGAPFKGWAYKISGQYRRGSVVKALTKNFQLPMGQSVVDLDLIPGGNISLPLIAPVVRVTSVAGKTGAITVEDLVDAGLGGGGTVPDEGITAQKLAPDSVTQAKIAPAAVGNAELDTDAVTASKVAADAITGVKIASGAVSKTKLSTALADEIDGKLTQAVADAAYAPIPEVSNAYASQLVVTETTPVATINTWLASPSPLGVKRLVGPVRINGAPVTAKSDTYLDLTAASFAFAPGATEGNMLVNAAVTPTATLTGVATTAGSSTVTGTGFTPAMTGKQVAVEGAGHTAYSGVAPFYGTFTYVSATEGTITPHIKAYPTSTLPATVTTTGRTMKVFDRDKNLRIVGGSIDRQPATLGPDGNNKHSVMLRRIDRGYLGDQTATTVTGAKYVHSIADVTDFTVERLRYPATGSDGLHFIGPASGVTVRDISGTTHDDLVSFTAKDFSLYSDTSGDFVGVHVDNVFSRGAVTAFKLITGTNVAAADFTVNAVDGWVTTRAIAVVDDNTGPTDVAVKFSNIGVYTTSTNTAHSIFNLNATAARSIEIEGLRLRIPDTGWTNANYAIAVTGKVDRLSVRDVRLMAGPANNGWTLLGILVSGGAGIQSVDMRGLNYLTGTSGNNHRVLYVHTPVGVITMSDSIIERMDKLIFCDFVTPLVVHWHNLRVTNVGNVIDTQGPLELRYSSTNLNAYDGWLRARGTAARAITLRGSGLEGTRVAPMTQSSSMLSLSGSTVAPTVQVYDQTFPIDVAACAPTMGQQARNVNAALACGVGPVVANGTSWKHLYTGAEYTP